MFPSLSQNESLCVSLDCGMSGYNMERLVVDKSGLKYLEIDMNSSEKSLTRLSHATILSVWY